MNPKPMEQSEMLLKNGYCVFENVVDSEMLSSLRNVSDKLLADQSPENQKLYYSTGSNISVMVDPFFAKLIAYPNSLAALAALGYPESKFSVGFIISKLPHSPRLFWHYDYAAWDDPDAFGIVPQQLFLMYYLVDTTPQNGCLRVIPGSHIHDHTLITEIHTAHSEELTRAEDLNRIEFTSHEDEVDVPVKAGDLLIGDSRLLHATHANNSVHRRTVITLFYHPDLQALSEPVRAFIAQKMTAPIPEEWPQDARNLIDPIRARYDGTVQPLKWNRNRPLNGNNKRS